MTVSIVCARTSQTWGARIGRRRTYSSAQNQQGGTAASLWFESAIRESSTISVNLFPLNTLPLTSQKAPSVRPGVARLGSRPVRV